jgi:hypothetical protein
MMLAGRSEVSPSNSLQSPWPIPVEGVSSTGRCQ